MSDSALALRVRLFVLCTVIAAVGSGIASFKVDDAFDLRLALGFGFLAFICEQFPVRIAYGASYSVTFVVTIATLIVAGPAEASIAIPFGTVSISRSSLSQPLTKHAFNAAQLSLTASLAGMTYVGLGGPNASSLLIPHALMPLSAAALVDFFVNSILVATVVGLSQMTPVFQVWRAQYRSLWPGYLAFTALGLLLGALYLQIGWGSVVFLLLPLLVARRAFQAAVRVQGAFDATVRSLVAAIEAKDPYTRGHAERVARLAEMTAVDYGLPRERARQVGYAALVHDVGKLVVQTRVLRKQGRLTPGEYEHMKSHPAKGNEIVREIDLLKDVLDGIRHHHERMDGRGYPDGLVGHQIPVAARIIMVADAFDAMTSTRTYRAPKSIDEALAELRRHAGTQFDLGAVDSLARAVLKHGWEPAPEVTAPQSISLIERAIARREGHPIGRLRGVRRQATLARRQP